MFTLCLLYFDSVVELRSAVKSEVTVAPRRLVRNQLARLPGLELLRRQDWASVL